MRRVVERVACDCNYGPRWHSKCSRPMGYSRNGLAVEHTGPSGGPVGITIKAVEIVDSGRAVGQGEL